jgi:hypothetical protein
MLSTGAKDMALGFFADATWDRYAQGFARLDDTAHFQIVAPPPGGEENGPPREADPVSSEDMTQ